MGIESPMRERATDVGIGGGEMLLSAASALVCRWGVTQVAERAQDSVLEVLKESRQFGGPPGVQISCTLGNFISKEFVTEAIGFCKQSGHSAVTAVAVIETATQLYRLANKDEGPWALDILSGSYRGAALGASAGLWESWPGNLGEKAGAVAVGAAFGSILGAGISGIGALARKISISVQDTHQEET